MDIPDEFHPLATVISRIGISRGSFHQPTRVSVGLHHQPTRVSVGLHHQPIRVSVGCRGCVASCMNRNCFERTRSRHLRSPRLFRNCDRMESPTGANAHTAHGDIIARQSQPTPIRLMVIPSLEYDSLLGPKAQSLPSPGQRPGNTTTRAC